jgi:hypothetical protein
VRVYICNLMTQANESLGLTASEHIERIYEHTRAPIFDCALVNTAPFSPRRWPAMRATGARPSLPTSSALRLSARHPGCNLQGHTDSGFTLEVCVINEINPEERCVRPEFGSRSFVACSPLQ